jgi:hypothetical protein
VRTALTINLKTDTDLLFTAKFTSEANRVFTSEANRVVGIDINAHLPGEPQPTPWSMIPGKNYSRCFTALAQAVRNAAILWKGCNDRLDRGERDSHTLPEYEAICETIRYGIAALIEADPQMDYQQKRSVVLFLRGSIVTDLTVLDANDIATTA